MNRTALVMIARNEARCIARALASARAWVSEMWVLDTGSTDDTVAIAQAHGAQVAHFTWCDDFAAARNAALALSSAPWRLVLDADEWIDGPAPCLAALQGRAPSFIGLVPVVSQMDGAVPVDGPDGANGQVLEAPSWLPRVLPRGIQYEGRIHEQPLSGALPRERLALRVLHDGYRAAQAQAKHGRNRRLLEQALAAAPQDAYLRYQLGKDFELQGSFAQAEVHYAPAWAQCGVQAGWRHDLLLRRLFTLKRLGQFEAALNLAQAEMPQWGHSPDFYFTLGDLLLGWAASEPQRAPELLPMIESSWLQALEIGERPDLQDTVSGRGSWLAAHNLAVFHDSLGDVAKAMHWRGRAAQARPAQQATL